MKDLRIEITDQGKALYLATDPDGVWAKTTRPDDLVTLDWDAQGRVIGIEAIGSAARDAIAAVVGALKRVPAADQEALDSALIAVAGEAVDDPFDEPGFIELVTSVEPQELHHAIDDIFSNDLADTQPPPRAGTYYVLGYRLEHSAQTNAAPDPTPPYSSSA